MSEALQTVPVSPANLALLPAASSGLVSMADIFFDQGKFDQVQRVALMMLRSPLIPEHIRGKTKEEGIANIVLALTMAMEMRQNPLIVMQNIYFVSGKAGWTASYMIAQANNSRAFRGPIRWRTSGAGKELSVTAYATLSQTGDTVEATADMKMAEAEGWTKNPKYRSMPEHMLIWRSATMLVRRYCPQVMLGMKTADELEDIHAAGPPAHRAPVESSTSALLGALDVQGSEVPEYPGPETADEREPGDESI